MIGTLKVREADYLRARELQEQAKTTPCNCKTAQQTPHMVSACEITFALWIAGAMGEARGEQAFTPTVLQ